MQKPGKVRGELHLLIIIFVHKPNSDIGMAIFVAYEMLVWYNGFNGGSLCGHCSLIGVEGTQ